MCQNCLRGFSLKGDFLEGCTIQKYHTITRNFIESFSSRSVLVFSVSRCSSLIKDAGINNTDYIQCLFFLNAN